MDDNPEQSPRAADAPLEEFAKSSDDHQCGYGKPPQRTQFKKGHSGNPRGRPKRTEDVSLVDEFRAAFLKKITIIEDGGRRKRISKLKVGFTRLANLFAQGDIAALREAVRLYKAIKDWGTEQPITLSKDVKDMTNEEIMQEWRRICDEEEKLKKSGA